MDIEGFLSAARRDFPAIGKGVAYMNNASSAPMPLHSIKAMTDFLVACSEKGPDSRATTDEIDDRVGEARNEIAKLINCRKEEVVFTQSTTEGVNYVARGLSLKRGESVIIRDSDHEHPANYVAWMRMKERRMGGGGVKIKKLSIDSDGNFDPDELRKKTDSRTRLVAISHALFNTGLILPVERVGRMAARKKVMFFLDGAQTAGCLPVDVKKIGCDFMAFTGSKWLCGPLGSGVFYCRREASEKIEPLQSGGESAFVLQDDRSGGGKVAFREMPRRMEGGFRNWAGIVGLAASVRYLTQLGGIPKIREKNMQLARMLREELGRLRNHVTLYGPEEESRRISIVSFSVGKVEPGLVVRKLEQEGIIFAKRDISGKRIVRASPHFFNHEREIQKAVDLIRTLQ